MAAREECPEARHRVLLELRGMKNSPDNDAIKAASPIRPGPFVPGVFLLGKYVLLRSDRRAPGSRFPPFGLAALRALFASAILFAHSLWSQDTSMALSDRELVIVSISGFLLYGGGAGLTAWAWQQAHSSLGAIFASTVPIWSAVMDAAERRQFRSRTSGGV